METKTVKKHKFNAIDAVILIVIAAVIGAAVFFFATGEFGGASETVMLEYVVEVRSIRDDYVDNFAIGEEIIDSVARFNLGEIVAIDVTPTTFNGNDLTTGTLKVYEYPEHSDVILTVVAEARLGENGRYIVGDGFDLSVGTAVYMRLPNYTGIGYCTHFREMEDIAR